MNFLFLDSIKAFFKRDSTLKKNLIYIPNLLEAVFLFNDRAL
ncbi:hypothetical protein DB41_II00100 [Neochlamydia sp. TUME1]|nr:hypothetical protein DB41_II00100 [Neochlamydia sp. TUME1]